MHSGKKAQSILVKSDEFENSYSLLYILLKSCLCCCSLAMLTPQQKTNKRIRILKTNLLRKFALSSIFFIQLHAVWLTFENLFRTIHFFNI